MPLTIGQKVVWTSSSTTKEGIIYQIVSANTLPFGLKNEMEVSYETMKKRMDALSPLPFAYGGGLPRNTESYLVLVPGNTSKSKGKLYWPNVNLLKALY